MMIINNNKIKTVVKLKQIFKIFLIFFSVLGPILGIYISIIINDAKLNFSKFFQQQKYQLTHTQQNFPVYDSDIFLEKDSFITQDHLYAYYFLASQAIPFNSWFENLLKEEKFKIFKGTSTNILLMESLNIGSLLENHCIKPNCIQYQIPFEKIPGKFWKGLIGIEDYRYLNHSGIDHKSIFRAFYADIKAMKLVQGGSTITQQLVKNLYLNSEKSVERKFREVIYSIYLETKFSKEEILAAYFNEVYWGVLQGIRIHGIYMSSIFYFFKRPEELNWFEVSILIGLLKGPSYYHPLHYLERLKSRTNLVYRKLIELKLIPNLKKDIIWNNHDWENWQMSLLQREKSKYFKSIWEILNDQNRKAKLYYNGEKKNEALNSFEKFILVDATKKTLIALKEKIRNEDIAVKVILGNPICKTKCALPFMYYSKIEREQKAALENEKHLVGSILKPILYSVFIKHGKNINDFVSTEQFKLKLKSGIWSPRESTIVRKKKVSLKDALRKSLNSPILRLAQEIGFDTIEKDLKFYFPTLKLPLKEYPAQLIGALELSLLEVYNVYAKFIRKECLFLSNLEKPENIFNNGEGSFEDSILYHLSDPTMSTIQKVVGNQLQSIRFFGKTGTTNNGLDNWYVVFDGKELIIIWLGLEGKRLDKKLSLSGATTAFKIFQAFYLNRGKRFSEFGCQMITPQLQNYHKSL